MGKLTISMAIFNSYVKLPEGSLYIFFRSGRATSVTRDGPPIKIALKNMCEATNKIIRNTHCTPDIPISPLYIEKISCYIMLYHFFSVFCHGQ